MKKTCTHPLVRKSRKGHRRKGIIWEYNWDGSFSREKIKGFFKQYWKRWQRRQSRQLQEEY